MVSLRMLLLALAVGLAAACGKSKTTDEEANGRVLELYMNYPGTQPDHHRPPEFDHRVASLINSASKEVYWAMYGFSREIIIDSVLNAVRRGLDVQLAGDYGTYASGSEGYTKFEELMSRYPNAKLISGNSQSIQHNKFVVVDRRYLMTGTGNITDSEIDRNYNVWVIIESKEMAEDFIRDHQMMMEGRFGHAKERLDYNNVFSVGGVKVEAYFSPYEDAMTTFLQAVGEAKKSVHFAIFAFTHDQLGRLLIDKHKQFTAAGNSTAVRGIMDRSQLTHNQYVEIYRMASACGHTYGFQGGGTNNPFTQTWTGPDSANTRCAAPIDFRIDGNENNSYIGDWQAGGGRLHAKNIAIDAGTPDAKLLMGSFNWSPNANDNNDENLIVIHSPKIVERYLKFWQEIYNDGVPLNRDRRGFCRNTGAVPGPGGCPGAEYQKVVISEVNYAGTTRRIGSTYYAYDSNEFIELYNPTNSVIDLSYWTFHFPVIENYSDPGIYNSGFPSAESLRKRGVIGLPGGTYIPPKGFLVAWQSDQRNDLNADGYSFPSSALYDPQNSATFGNKLTAYNPANGLSDFFTLFDRRTSSTGRTGSFPSFYWPAFMTTNQCRPAYDIIVDRFSGSSFFSPYTLHTGWDGTNTANYPHRTSLWIELRDSRGNLVDIAGGNRLNSGVPGGGAPTSHDDVRYFKGGFHDPASSGNTSNATRRTVGSTTPNMPVSGGIFPLATANSSAADLASIDVICNAANIDYMSSMERNAPSGLWGPGTDTNSWDHATLAGPRGTNVGTYIKPDYKHRTIATPGEINSRWTGAP